MLARAIYPVLGFPNSPGEVGGSDAPAELKSAARQAAEDALAELLEVIHTCYLRQDDFIGGATPSIVDFRFAATLEFLPAVNYSLPEWAQAYQQRMEQQLGQAFLEPAADVRGYLAYVKSQQA
jgi:glutathione S-transferase